MVNNLTPGTTLQSSQTLQTISSFDEMIIPSVGFGGGSTVHSNPISHQYGVTHGEHRLRIIFRKDLLFGSEPLGGLRIEKKL